MMTLKKYFSQLHLFPLTRRKDPKDSAGRTMLTSIKWKGVILGVASYAWVMLAWPGGEMELDGVAVPAARRCLAPPSRSSWSGSPHATHRLWRRRRRHRRWRAPFGAFAPRQPTGPSQHADAKPDGGGQPLGRLLSVPLEAIATAAVIGNCREQRMPSSAASVIDGHRSGQDFWFAR